MRKSIHSGETVLSARSLDTRTLWPRVALVAGDIVSFLVFAGVGRQSHNETSGLGAIALIAETAAPFALGWFLVSPFVGAFRHALIGAPRHMLARTECAWLAAWPLTLAFRWLVEPTHVSLSKFATFALVALISNAIFLGVWRFLFALVTRPRK